MDSLENYLLAVMKENKVTLEPNDPLCVLHTILSKFEDDLLESQRKCLEAFKSDIEASCSSIEATEKLRAERALSYIQASAEKMLVGLPEKLNSAIQQEAFKKQLLKYAPEAIGDGDHHFESRIASPRDFGKSCRGYSAAFGEVIH